MIIDAKKDYNNKILNYIDYLINNSTPKSPMWNIEQIRSGCKNKWNYVDGCMITAFIEIYKKTGAKKYLEYADNYMDYYINEDGTIKTYSNDEYNIDNINPARTLFFLYDITRKEKYIKAIDTVYAQLQTMPRTKKNNFWHKKIYENQIWLDGLYMAQPFYMQYGKKYNNQKICTDSYMQFENVEKHMKDKKTGLYYHAYDSNKQMFWANKESGCSENFWLRAIGWFAASLVDVIEIADEDMTSEKHSISLQFRELTDSLLTYQHPEGMFYQVVDKKEVKGNYLETSGTMLIAYAILKGVRLGVLPKEYYQYGEKAFYATLDRYLKKNENGNLVLGGICLVAGLGGENRRDGSVEYYLSEPVVENEAKGIAPMILAYSELIQ